MFEPNNYFKIIAEQHTEILHTADKPAYFREYTTSKIILRNSDLLAKMKWAKNTVLVSQFNGDSYTSGNNSDNLSKKKTGAVFIISKVLDGNIDNAQKKTEQIIDDIIARIEFDSSPENSNVPIYFANLKEIQVSSVGMIGDNFYGHAMFISYNEPNCNEYNSEKWQT